MIKEFEGKTEKEAISKAVSELGLQQDEFDVEILETVSNGIFKRGSVKIRVHVEDESTGVPHQKIDFEGDLEKETAVFVTNIIEKMGYPGSVSVNFRDERKIGLDIKSEHSAILIGKKGKNMDAIQLLANVYLGKITPSDEKPARVIIDSENYRRRREDSIVRMARKTAEQVCRSKNSKLLEPMNPFERRLIHTALNDMNDVITKSEGDGLYKQVRIIYKGSRE
ncbi:RNA-binding cell elongation regulator Jag/EloR [Spirochaeta isovalerica]|uniref:RNA-binding protein KhpB n=1 Tax=Spirochaeta isovalerica TaxID=150 RepID=A0A841RII5_9SPIO|nr:RNA-binding cell elongation regulator Jag/EloR [Spirochaeta isovalerica]MBB6482338.1 spoIIIJ-associated protein [Spirochaeta isovalerica]